MAFLSQRRRQNPMDEVMSFVQRAQQNQQGPLFGSPAPSGLAYSRPTQNRANEDAAARRGPRRRPEPVVIEIDGVGRIEMGPEFDRLPPDQQQAAVDEIAGQFGGGEPRGYEAGLLSQGLSGVNEGIAGTLGLPVDLATSAANLIPAGIDAVAGTNLGRIENPIAGGEWFRERGRDIGAIRPESSDPTSQFTRRVGQSAGAAAIPVAGTAGSLGRAALGMIPAIGGGAGAATARQAFPDNPIAEFAGEMLGTAATGAGMIGAARGSARRAARNAVPTTAQLRERATELYAQAESRGVVAGPDVTNRLAERVREIARREALITPTGRTSTAYPRAAEAMNLMDDYAGHDLNPTQMQVIRETLTDAVGGTRGRERRIANMMLRSFDEATVPLAPELAQARGVAGRYLQADRIAAARETARANSSLFTGSGSENAIRNQFRQLDRRIIKDQERFHPDVDQAIQNVSRGTPASNAARAVGRLAPTGIVSGGLSAGVPFMVGNAVGGPAMGGAAAAGSMMLGGAGRALATRQTEQAAAMAELIARNGGRLNYGSAGSGIGQQIAPSLAGQTAPYMQQSALPSFMNDDMIRQAAALERQAQYEEEERRRRSQTGPRY